MKSYFIFTTRVALFGLALTISNIEQVYSEAALPDAKSPAEQKMDTARKAIEKNPKNAEPYNALALALANRARETADPKYYDEAAETLKKSFELVPDNFEGRKIETWLALGKHEFSRALEMARALNKRMPDDVLVYSLLTDACIETGHYDEAEKPRSGHLICVRVLSLVSRVLPIFASFLVKSTARSS